MAVALLAFGVACAETKPQPKRWAFVVGNDVYKNLAAHHQLTKAVGDSRAIAQTFHDLHYDDVLTGENLGRSDFYALWQKLLDKAGPEDTVAIYFSGHGIEIDGRNYLIPSDFPPAVYGREERAKRESISVSDLMLDLKGKQPKAKLVLMILDACRDHPLIPPGQKGLDEVGGLATMEPPSGTFIMYAAGAGQTALDHLPGNDPDPNSVYTRKLVPLLKTKGLTIVELAQRVRREVHLLAATASHEQVPTYYDGVLNPFCVAGCEEDKVAEAPAGQGPAESPGPPANVLAVSTAAAGGGSTRSAPPDATSTQTVTEAPPAVSSQPQRENPPATPSAPAQMAMLAGSEGVPPDPKVLTRSIQAHLKRLGCFTVEPTGTWGPKTMAAARLYNDTANADQAITETGPTKEAEASLAAIDQQICQPQEAAAASAESETCVTFADPKPSPTPPAPLPGAGTFVIGDTDLGSKRVDGLLTNSIYDIKAGTSLPRLGFELMLSGNTEFREYTPEAPFACGHALYRISTRFVIHDVQSSWGQAENATGSVNARVEVLRWAPQTDDNYAYEWQYLTSVDMPIDYECGHLYGDQYECFPEDASVQSSTKEIAAKLSGVLGDIPETASSTAP